MDREAWQATVHKKSETPEGLAFTFINHLAASEGFQVRG